MKDFLKTIQRESILRSICLIGFGVLALFIPKPLYNATIIIIVGFLLVMGIFNLISGIKMRKNEEPHIFRLLYSGMLLVAALIVYLYNVQLASFTVIVLGILIVINGISDILIYTHSQEYSETPAKALLVIGIGSVIAGVIVIFNPFGTVLLLFRFIGVVLMIVGIADIYFMRNIMSATKIKKVN